MLRLHRTTYAVIHITRISVSRARNVQLHKFVSHSRLSNGISGHRFGITSVREDNFELSIYISTLILEYLVKYSEVRGLIVVVSHCLGFIRLSSHSSCRILTSRSLDGEIIICEMRHLVIAVGSIWALAYNARVLFSARQHLDCLSGASLAGYCSSASLMSQEALGQLRAKLVFHTCIVSFLISIRKKYIMRIDKINLLLLNYRYRSSRINTS